MPGHRFQPGTRSVRFYRHPMGSVGCTIGLAPHLYVGAMGASPADALSQAGALAAQLQNLAQQHPEVAQALNLIPGGAAAMQAISIAAKLYDSPLSIKDAAAAVAKTVGPTVANVVKGILSIF